MNKKILLHDTTITFPLKQYYMFSLQKHTYEKMKAKIPSFNHICQTLQPN